MWIIFGSFIGPPPLSSLNDEVDFALVDFADYLLELEFFSEDKKGGIRIFSDSMKEFSITIASANVFGAVWLIVFWNLVGDP